MALRAPVPIWLLALLLGLALLAPVAAPPLYAPTAGPTPPISRPFSGTTLYLPIVQRGGAALAGEWTQQARDAQRTAYTPDLPPAPWRWKWAWNGPDALGAVSAGKFRLPRNSQPVTGGGRVYISAGTRGVYALNQMTGAQLWNANPGGALVNSTPAYDPLTASLFVASTNGVLYKLDSATGAVQDQFATGQSSDLPLAPALQDGQIWLSMGTKVFALSTLTLDKSWEYLAGSPVHTPPAYSAAAGRVIVATQDLYVHAIDDSSGLQAWRVKPTPLSPGDPGDDSDNAEVSYGWPVIAEAHGLVLVKLRLDWNTLWNPWSPWPGDNASMRSGLAAQPQYQALYALRLSDGSVPFIANVGHGGFGDGGYLPMGPMPVVRQIENGPELAYVVMRGDPCLVGGSACDGRGDSRFGELLLDSLSVPGYQAGDVRFMDNTYFPTDEQANLAMAGEALFGGHWMYGIAHLITDRSAGYGSAASPIPVSDLPHIITSSSSCGFSPDHYCPNGLVQDGDSRAIPGGFYIYYNQGPVYDAYWSGYASWVISAGQVYFVSTDGALVALEPGSPSLQPGYLDPPPARALEPAVSPVSIDYTQAGEHAYRLVRVGGTLRWVFNNGKAVYLGFKDPHQGVFLARILKEDWTSFPAPPERLYRPGQRVRITGRIGWYQGDPHILVRSPAQIEILP